MLLTADKSDDVTADDRQLQQQQDEHETYCETETFNATCDAPGDVILVTHALYGRMQLSRCTKIDYGHIGCSSDVTELADARCSGRQACEIAIPDALFAKSQPCPEDLKPYLEVGYKCLSGKQLRLHDFILAVHRTYISIFYRFCDVVTYVTYLSVSYLNQTY